MLNKFLITLIFVRYYFQTDCVEFPDYNKLNIIHGDYNQIKNGFVYWVTENN